MGTATLAVATAVILFGGDLSAQEVGGTDTIPFAAGFSARIEGIKSRGDHLRTDPEFLSLRAGGGNYGPYGMLSFSTVRWRYFYLDIARFFISGGRDIEGNKRALTAGMGIALGIPWHLDPHGRHEIRFGLGLGAGMIRGETVCRPLESGFSGRTCEYHQQAFGLILSPEVYYVLKGSSGPAFFVGADVHLATYPNKFFEDPDDVVDSELKRPDPCFNAFVGVRF